MFIAVEFARGAAYTLGALVVTWAFYKMTEEKEDEATA